MSNKNLKQEIIDKYQNSGLLLDLRSLVAEKERNRELELARNNKKKFSINKFFTGLKLKKNIKILANTKDLAIDKIKKEFEDIKEFKVKKIKFKKINLKKPRVFKKIKKTLTNRKKIVKKISKRQEILLARVQEFIRDPELIYSKEKREEKKRKNIFRKIPSLFFIMLFLVVPLKVFSSLGIFNFKTIEEKVFNNSFSGFNNLIAAADSISQFDFQGANLDFSAAGSNFLVANDELAKINDGLFALASLSPDPKIKLASQAKKFLSAGVTASALGKNLVTATDSLFSGNDDFEHSLNNFINYGFLAVNDAKNLEQILNDINQDSLPIEYQSKFLSLKQQVRTLANDLDEFLKLSDKLKDLLGLSNDKRYLLVFQNNSEIRASGGFLGSYALVDLRNGKIKNLEVPAGGSYDLEAGLNGKKFQSPYPLQLINRLWKFWDANWWPDWPKSAKNLMWFYQESGGPSVDGVISLTPTVIERMLEITGPIDMIQEYGLVINSENFWETVQKVVEYKNIQFEHPEAVIGIPATSTPINSSLPLTQDLINNVDNKPKKIIGDLMAKMLEILPKKISRENLPLFISVIEDSVLQKQILFYFKDEKIQSEIVKYGLSGEMKKSDYDYLMMVDTNISGQKTDRVIKKEAALISEIQENGDIINTLKIKRNHQGVLGEPFTGVINTNWLRIYVPLNSKLLSAKGFSIPPKIYLTEADKEAKSLAVLDNELKAEIDDLSQTFIYNEDEKTVFANWTMTNPSEITEIEIKYLLPFNFHEIYQEKNTWLEQIYSWLNEDNRKLFPYSLLLQKQPGAYPFPFSWKVNLINDYEVFWRPENNETGKIGENILFDVKTILNRDRFFGVLLNKLKK